LVLHVCLPPICTSQGCLPSHAKQPSHCFLPYLNKPSSSIKASQTARSSFLHLHHFIAQHPQQSALQTCLRQPAQHLQPPAQPFPKTSGPMAFVPPCSVGTAVHAYVLSLLGNAALDRHPTRWQPLSAYRGFLVAPHSVSSTTRAATQR
jgi:hypothetical protein